MSMAFKFMGKKVLEPILSGLRISPRRPPTAAKTMDCHYTESRCQRVVGRQPEFSTYSKASATSCDKSWSVKSPQSSSVLGTSLSLPLDTLEASAGSVPSGSVDALGFFSRPHLLIVETEILGQVQNGSDLNIAGFICCSVWTCLQFRSPTGYRILRG